MKIIKILISEGKYNYYIRSNAWNIVFNKFFTPRHVDKEAKLPQKLWAFKKKFMVYYFSVSTIVHGPLKEGPGQMSSMPSFLTRYCWDSQLFFIVKYLMLNLTSLLRLSFALE